MKAGRRHPQTGRYPGAAVHALHIRGPSTPQPSSPQSPDAGTAARCSWPHPETDEPSGDEAQGRNPPEEAEHEWHPFCPIIVHVPRIQPAQHPQLNQLRDPGRKRAPSLNAVQLERATATKRWPEDVGRRDRVLHREVDADPAGRRHGVGGIPDHSRPGRCHRRADPRGRSSKLDVVPVGERVHARGLQRQQRSDQIAELLQRPSPQLRAGSLADQVRGLPVVVAVRASPSCGRRPARRRCGRDRAVPRQPEPQHVHRCAGPRSQPGVLAHRRRPSVARDHEVCADVEPPLHPGHERRSRGRVVPRESDTLGAEPQLEDGYRRAASASRSRKSHCGARAR